MQATLHGAIDITNTDLCKYGCLRRPNAAAQAVTGASDPTWGTRHQQHRPLQVWVPQKGKRRRPGGHIHGCRRPYMGSTTSPAFCDAAGASEGQAEVSRTPQSRIQVTPTRANDITNADLISMGVSEGKDELRSAPRMQVTLHRANVITNLHLFFRICVEQLSICVEQLSICVEQSRTWLGKSAVTNSLTSR